MSTHVRESDKVAGDSPVNNQPVVPERARMNIPNAVQHTTALVETRDHDNDVYQAQFEALETALNEPVGKNGVTLDLANPLHSDIAQQLSENGYAYTTSSVSSYVNGETRLSNTVTVYPEPPVDVLDQFNFESKLQRNLQRRRQNLFEFFRYFMSRPKWFLH